MSKIAVEREVVEQVLGTLLSTYPPSAEQYTKERYAITALRQALEQPAQQEPVAYVDGDEAHRRILWEPSQAAFDLAVGTKLYTTPPRREWVGLTDEQKLALCKQFPDHLTFNAIEAIEAKLKEKNT